MGLHYYLRCSDGTEVAFSAKKDPDTYQRAVTLMKDGKKVDDDYKPVSGEDLILVFLEERCVFSPGGTCDSMYLWEVYKEWSIYGTARSPMPRKYLEKALVEAGAHRAKGARTWNGASLRPIPPDPTRTEGPS